MKVEAVDLGYHPYRKVGFLEIPYEEGEVVFPKGHDFRGREDVRVLFDSCGIPHDGEKVLEDVVLSLEKGDMPA